MVPTFRCCWYKYLAARAPKVDSSMIYVAEEEDDDENYVEAGEIAAVNQEIKRTITEVPVKVTDELFDEIVTKVLIRYDMTVEVDDRIVTSNHKVSQISPLVLTPKVSAKVLIPVEDKETETEAVSRKSSSGSPGDVFSLGSYASDRDDEDDELQNPHIPKPICSMAQLSPLTQYTESYVDSSHPSIQQAASVDAVAYLLKNDILTLEALVREMGIYLPTTDDLIRARDGLADWRAL